jgi:hypothetical protein
MIQELVDRFMANEETMKTKLAANPPSDYREIVKLVVEAVTEYDYGPNNLDPTRIHAIDDGEYQGTLVFVIGAKGYQPSDYWYCRVCYGSCSGCDTLEAIRGHGCETPTPQQATDYWTLALHVVQSIKKMDY